LSRERLKELLLYDEVTGKFYWRVKVAQCVHIGDEAGGLDSNGYRHISIGRVKYKAHRLAWFYVHGVWPESKIDHRDGDKGDALIALLREATPTQNNRNARIRKDNKSGFKGVGWKVDQGKWCARIWTDCGRKHLGYFSTPEEAYAAYCAAAEIHHQEFARVA